MGKNNKMAQVVNRVTGEVYGDPNPERGIAWEHAELTTPGKRAPQIEMRAALEIVASDPNLYITCPHGKWWSFGSSSKGTE